MCKPDPSPGTSCVIFSSSGTTHTYSMSSKPAQLACYMIFTLGDHSVNAILEFDDKEQFYSIHILNEFQAAKLVLIQFNRFFYLAGLKDEK